MATAALTKFDDGLRDFRRRRRQTNSTRYVSEIRRRRVYSSAPVSTSNSVLYGASHYFTHKLQRVQNSLARIILQSDSLAHSEPLLRQLHSLPVHSRIRFKLATIIHKALCTNSPQYLASHIRYHQSVRSFRSSDQHFLVPTPSSTNFSYRSFRSAAPVI